jgi:hypothetical protein
MGLHIAANSFEAIGFAFREQATSDFGIDAHLERRCESGGTGALLALQIKSGDSYFREAADDGWRLRTDQKHANYWLEHALPVVIVQVDVEKQRVYWEAVTKRTVQFTEKGAKILIRKDRQVDAEAVPALLKLLSPVRDLDPVAEGSDCRVFLGRGISGKGGWTEFAAILVDQLVEIGCVTGWDILIEVRTAAEDDELTFTNEDGACGEDLVSIYANAERRVATYSVSSEEVDKMDLLWDEDCRAEAAADAIVEHLAAADGLLDDEDDIWLDEEDSNDET